MYKLSKKALEEAFNKFLKKFHEDFIFDWFLDEFMEESVLKIRTARGIFGGMSGMLHQECLQGTFAVFFLGVSGRICE